MKKALKIISIALITAGLLAFAYAAFYRSMYFGVMDGSSELYSRLRHNMTVSFWAGTALTAAGAVCLIICSKMRKAGGKT